MIVTSSTRTQFANLALGLVAATAAGCGGGGGGTTLHPTNVLIIVGDDIGIDMIPAYGVSATAPPLIVLPLASWVARAMIAGSLMASWS